MVTNIHPLSLGARIFGALFCVGVVWLWYSVIQFQTDDVGNYSVVTGTLVSADERISYVKTKSGRLEIRLKENTVRYCVDPSGYLEYFNRKAFFNEVSKGDTVQLSALASEIAAPRTFLLNSTPTVFVYGVQADGRDYCTVQDHIAWQKREYWVRLGFAVCGSGIIALAFVRTRRFPVQSQITRLRK